MTNHYIQHTHNTLIALMIRPTCSYVFGHILSCLHLNIMKQLSISHMICYTCTHVWFNNSLVEIGQNLNGFQYISTAYVVPDSSLFLSN